MDMALKDVESVLLYFEAYIVMEPGLTPHDQQHNAFLEARTNTYQAVDEYGRRRLHPPALAPGVSTRASSRADEAWQAPCGAQ